MLLVCNHWLAAIDLLLFHWFGSCSGEENLALGKKLDMPHPFSINLQRSATENLLDIFGPQGPSEEVPKLMFCFIFLKFILSNDLRVTGLMQTKFETAEECGSFWYQIFRGSCKFGHKFWLCPSGMMPPTWFADVHPTFFSGVKLKRVPLWFPNFMCKVLADKTISFDII